MSPQNLTNVYNQNPTLQGQYTLQQYLDLFGGSSTPPPATIQPVPTPNVPETGIINQNINQYQGGGDDKYTGFGAFGNLDESTAKTEYRDVSDGKGGSTIEKFTTYMDPGGLRKTFDVKNVTHGGLDIKPMAISLFDALTGKEEYKGEYPEAGKTLGTFSNRKGTNNYGVPFADLSIFQKIKMDMSRNKELKQYAAELQKQKELKAQIEREAQAAQRQSDQARINRAYRQETGGQGGSYATGESGVQSDGSYNDPFDPGGGEKDGGYIDGTNRRKDYRYGGRASYFDGGIVSLRRR